MTNRHQRRAETKTAAAEPSWPSIHGGTESCGNCGLSADRDVYNNGIVKRMADRELAAGRPAPQPLPADETLCLAEPRDHAKKVWGWCPRWQASWRVNE